MELEKGHTSVRRGVSWSPGGLRKPLQATQDMHTPGTDCNASWEKTGFNKEQMSRKTNLTRSASLSEKELKEARVRSQIIAAQLTVPSNSSSRGVQLFNRRRQRVNAFTLESGGEGSEEDRVENVISNPSSNKLSWAERSSEEKDRDLNYKNSSSRLLCLSPGMSHPVSDIMEEPGKDFHEEEETDDCVIQERHFLPVKEIEEEEEARDKIHEELEDTVKDETPHGSNNTDPVVIGHVEGEAEINGSHTWPVPAGKLVNGCHSTSGPERVSVSTSRQATGIINRTARPFFSPPTVQSPEAASPVMDIPPAPSYATPPLPPQPLAFSPPPPPPSYPTPPLPAFTNQPQHTYYSSPPPMSPVMSLSSPPPSQFPPAVSPVSQYLPMPHYGPPTAPKPSTFVPQPISERKSISAIKTGILEEGAARRANRKSMFTFKEKPVVAPNPELLSLVQGVDKRKKDGSRSVPEPASEEELLALGAEASNFLAKDEDRAVEEAKAPEWASCLKSSRTRPRSEHRPEQTLTNVSGKGAELFAKRQSRMEKYVVEKQNPGQMRSPSPTMSLPPSWVYPSNMPGRVKAIARNSEMSAQLTQNLKAQQAVKQKPKPKAPAPEPVPEPTPVENGCSKIEMDLSRHRPYQLNSSLFILKPINDPISTLPRAAPQSKNLISTQSFSRQTSLPSSPLPHFSAPYMSPQLPLSPTGGYPPDLASGQQRINSPMSAFSPERVTPTRSGVQAPRPTFSAKKAGIEVQTPKESYPGESCSETPTPTTTPSFTRRFSSPEGPSTGSRTPSLRPSTNISSSSHSVISPVSSPRGTRCQSPLISQNMQYSSAASSSSSRPSKTPTATSPRSPPWGSRCQSPMMGQNTQSSTVAPSPTFRPTQTSTTPTPPWGSRCQSPMVSQSLQSSTASSISTSRPFQTSTATSQISPPWGSRCKSPMVSQNAQPSTISSIPTSKPSQTTSPFSPPWGSRCQSPMVSQSSTIISTSTSRPSHTATSPVSPLWGSRCQSPALSQTSLSFPATKPLYTSTASSPVSPPKDSRCMSPTVNNLDSKANHRLLAKNIINAAKRKNSASPGALSGHSLPISPVGNSHHGYDCHKPPISPFQPRALGTQSPTFTSPPPTPTQRICSPVRLYNTRSLTDSDASVESEDSGLRSPGLYSYNTCPRGWGGSLRVKRSTVSTDL